MSARDVIAGTMMAYSRHNVGELAADAILAALHAMPDAARIALARELVPPGWAVVRDCGDAPHIPTGRDEHTPDYADGHADGWEQARAAFIASGEETP